MPNTEFYSVVPSPVGELTLVSNGGALTGLYLADARHARVAESTWVRDDARLSAAARQLAEYFAGKRTHFDLPLAAVGTPFQREVWQALRAIPYGATLSYAELATRVGSPRAVRAVGAANGRNPISIVVPCHRVVGSDGSLTGYAGGLARKQWLLALEARTPADLLRVPPEVGARTSGFIHDSDTAPRGTHDETPSHRSHRPENPSLASRDLL